MHRIGKEIPVALLHEAFNHGVRFFDTARWYNDSEEKLATAFQELLGRVVIELKTMALTPLDFRRELETSLRLLRTDYLGLYQFHNGK